MEDVVLLASDGQRPGMLLSILQCTDSPWSKTSMLPRLKSLPYCHWPQRALKKAVGRQPSCSEPSYTEVDRTGLGLEFSVRLYFHLTSGALRVISDILPHH